MENNFSITIAKTEQDFSEAKVLFLEYAKELSVDLCFQNFDRELKEISFQYNEPTGVLLLLKDKDENIGCVGLRKFENPSLREGFRMGYVSEIKRMYIKKEFRGKGLSKKLITELLSHSRRMNYKSVRLDTLPQMKEAVRLYLSVGFKEIKPYRFNPVDGTKYMELNLG